MKYVIDVPDNPMFVTACYLNDGIPKAFNLELEPYTEPDRKAIEDEVWNFVDFMIYEMDGEEREECFGKSAYAVCIHESTYQGAKAGYDEWKKQKVEIRVGDECVDEDGDKCVVVCNVDYNMCDVIYDDGSTDEVHKHFLRKTGRHYDYIEKLLEKMQED